MIPARMSLLFSMSRMVSPGMSFLIVKMLFNLVLIMVSFLIGLLIGVFRLRLILLILIFLGILLGDLFMSSKSYNHPNFKFDFPDSDSFHRGPVVHYFVDYKLYRSYVFVRNTPSYVPAAVLRSIQESFPDSLVHMDFSADDRRQFFSYSGQLDLFVDSYIDRYVSYNEECPF